MTYYSQSSQDKYLESEIFRGFKRGVFVDVGAWDGVELNNTLFFENTHKWTGINVEPIPDIYQRLVKNRPACVNLNVAVTDTEGETEFLHISGPTGCLSGIQSNYDPRHVHRIDRESAQLGTTKEVLRVKTRRLDSIFREHNIKRVHYLSVDVEGSEFNVLKSIDFDEVYIDVIGFENNYPDKTPPIIDYLKQYGYVELNLCGEDMFMIRKNSPFAPPAKPLSFLRR